MSAKTTRGAARLLSRQREECLFHLFSQTFELKDMCVTLFLVCYTGSHTKTTLLRARVTLTGRR